MSEEVEDPRIGAGALAAFGRAGFKEMAQALVALPDSNIRPVEEPGLPSNLTQSEVVETKRESYESVLASYASRGSPVQEQETQMER